MTAKGKETDGAPPSSEEVDVLFKQWEKEEAKVDLSDLNAWDSIVFAVFWILFAVVFLQLFRPLRAQRFPGLDRGDRQVSADRRDLHRVGDGDAQGHAHRGRGAVQISVSRARRHQLLLAIDLIVALFCIFLAVTAAQLSLRTNQFMVTINVSKALVYWVVCASFVAMAFVCRLAFRSALAASRGRRDQIADHRLDHADCRPSDLALRPDRHGTADRDRAWLAHRCFISCWDI